MAGFLSTNTDHLTRSNLWSNEIKMPFEAMIQGNQYINWISDFPDGDTLNIPSIGVMEAQDFAEGEAVRYTAIDTGNFTFSIDKYLASATYVSTKFLQDSYYMSRVQSQFVPMQRMAIERIIEGDIMAVGPNAQTASNSNTINNAKHRMVGSGASEKITIEDFHRARFALRKAFVPMDKMIAIVDPSVEYEISTQPNLLNFSAANPRWEGVVETGLTTGLKFFRNIAGWDVYTSDYLKVNTTSETIDGVTAAAGVNNLFFAASAQPFMGAVRQPPKVESEYNKDLQREEYVTTCRYGMKLYRPEALVVVLTDTDQIYV